nr:putative reverse transcriptase domain-containing protein [Tanacetum cinerariifolium]
LSRVHSTFHVSNLKKCLSDEPLAISMDEVHIDEKLRFVEEPIEIMDREVKRLKQSRIPIIKVRWNSRRGPEFTWEREDQFRKKYPQLFTANALCFQNPRYLKKAQQLKPNLYDGTIIGKYDVIVVPDSENTLLHAEEIEVPKELPKVSMVNSCLKRLKYQLASFDIVVKERTTATAITEGTWGFEHTKACFRDDIIPFVKILKDLFTSFDQYLIDEVSEVQRIFKQMEMVVEQNCAAKSKFQSKMETVLKENDRLLKHALDNVSSSESAPNFAELFETNELKAQIQEKDTMILKLKEKIRSLRVDDQESKVEDIETQNLELDHRVTKLTA